MKFAYWTALALLAALGGCASIQPARMALPPALATTSDVVVMEGLGGGRRGQFQVGAHAGEFARSEERLVLFDTLETRRGGSRFTLSGPQIDGRIEAACVMRERNITIGVANFTAKPMSYQCDLTSNGRPFPARFELQEARNGPATLKSERRGEIALDRVILQIRSVHALEGSPFQTDAPIGYVFELIGLPVGAVELNGAPRLFLPRGDDPALQRAVIAGSVALAVFWDPANSALGD